MIPRESEYLIPGLEIQGYRPRRRFSLATFSTPRLKAAMRIGILRFLGERSAPDGTL